jgi:hypothetical protein
MRRSGLEEDRTIALKGSPTRPVIDHLHELEAAGGDFVDDEAGRHAVAVPIARDTRWRPRPQPGKRRRKIDDCENAAGAHGAQKFDVHRFRITQVVVNAAQDDGVAAIHR